MPQILKTGLAQYERSAMILTILTGLVSLVCLAGLIVLIKSLLKYWKWEHAAYEVKQSMARPVVDDTALVLFISIVAVVTVAFGTAFFVNLVHVMSPISSFVSTMLGGTQ